MSSSLSRILITTLGLIVATSLAPAVQAQTESTIYQFGSSAPNYPHSGFTADASENLYGVSPSGAVYRLSRVSGVWQATVLYSFTGQGDGGTPYATPVFDRAGNLYGTTNFGGTYGAGVVYKLTPTTSGSWTETVLYSFTGGNDGGYPAGGNLVIDKAGNLYGSNAGGGNLTSEACQNTAGCGVIFELQPVAGGKWKFHLLHPFSGGWDGVGPAQLTFSPSGVLFGSAPGAWGGFEAPNAPGLVFRLTPTTTGPWKDSVVYSFTGGNDGGLPTNVIFDQHNNIYGAGSDGGTSNNCWSGYGPIGCGVVFKISLNSSGKWTETVLYNFNGLSDGAQPDGGVVFSKGSLYGATWAGGTGDGVVYQLTPSADGTWSQTIIHTFAGPDGAIPIAPLLVDPAGNLFGITEYGGTIYNYGVAFEVTP